MASCDDVSLDPFPCLPNTLLGWSSLAYILLPVNIALYDLQQLYTQNCRIFTYHSPFSNIFQTGILSFICCLLSIIHGIASFQCDGCSQSKWFCYVDEIAVYCIYFILSMLSWTRLFCKYKIMRFHKSKNKTKHLKHTQNVLLFA